MEINKLQTTIDGLNEVLASTGTGDLSKELAASQEKLSVLQTEYYQTLGEKEFLQNQLKSSESEKQALEAYQNKYYEYVQAQQFDLDMLNKNMASLNTQLEMEKATVIGKVYIYL